MRKENFGRLKIGLRFVQSLFVVAAIFGVMWQTTLYLALSIQGFLMFYGASGAAACEIGVRLLEWKFPESELEKGD